MEFHCKYPKRKNILKEYNIYRIFPFIQISNINQYQFNKSNNEENLHKYLVFGKSYGKFAPNILSWR